MGEIHVEGKGSKVLVFGDAMIDRSWVVAEGAETSQAHSDVPPQKVVDPNSPNLRPGGAGLVSAWLAWDRRLEVRLLAQAGAELKPLLTQANVSFFPDLLSADRQTTTKFRIYAYNGADRVPPLRHRYDLDVFAEQFELPDVGEPELVVVADFQKGMVTSERLDQLATRSKAVPWLVDSKNASIVGQPFVKQLRVRPTLFVNRSEFARIAAQLRDLPEQRRSDALSGPWFHVEAQLLSAARAFYNTYARWDLVVKLDRDGAVAFWLDNGVWTFARVPASAQAAVGIGAGDAFLAGWASALLAGASMPERLAAGVGRASAWLQIAEKLPHLASPSDVPAGPSPTPTVPSALEVSEELDRLAGSRRLSALISGGSIDLSLAGGHCGQFMTLNADVGTTVRHFAAEIHTFFESKGPRRPLNCLVWAEPGSGKSFLVEEVARHVGAKLYEINVSTMVDRDELKHELEDARRQDEQAVLVMIDECAAKIGDEYIFAALLAPLWSRPRAKKLAFVLVDSYPKAKSVDDFASFIAGQAKGPDLISRINGPRIALAAPNELDRAVLVASMIRRMHPSSAYAIESTALQALVRENPRERWSPRSIEYVIEAIVPSSNVVTYKDLLKLRELCDRMHIQLRDDADPAPSRIDIRDAIKSKFM